MSIVVHLPHLCCHNYSTKSHFLTLSLIKIKGELKSVLITSLTSSRYASIILGCKSSPTASTSKLRIGNARQTFSSFISLQLVSYSDVAKLPLCSVPQPSAEKSARCRVRNAA
ncbi:hypothetical protein J6590_063078 [Homalodisca vitripennis]|nr:hypothetical protein J6590_063078 [Homalodisca vitripennis]